jgi:predicted peroxiredoxin
MRKSALTLTLAVLTAIAWCSVAAAAEESKPNLFIVVTSADPQTQGMAMVLTMESMKQGARVDILLCGPGGDMALKGASQVTLKPKNVTPQAMLGKVLDMGVKAEVCALYLPNNGKTPDDLIDGVGVAKPPVIASAMLAPNTRLFTF